MAVTTHPLTTHTSLDTDRLLSDRSSSSQSSAIRDLLDQAKRPGMISLAGGLPDSSLFPVAQLAEIAATVIVDEGESLLQYSTTQGSPQARTGLAALFSDAADDAVDPDRLIVTTGSQQALDLIARVVVNPGDQVVVGDPDYLGALQVFRNAGAEVRPIAVDQDGLDTAQLEDQLKWGLRPKCCYIVPHFHNPTGVTMSTGRRAHLQELSSRYGFLVIEDDPYRDLFYDRAEPQDAANDPELTVQLRSISKVLAPGLRVGAMMAPQWLISPIVVAKQSCDLHTSSLTQAVAMHALAAPWYPGHLARLRTAYQAKRDVLVSALHDGFGPSVEFVVPAGGMFIWARLGPVEDSTDWLTACLEEDVCFVPGSAFSVARDLSSYVRLSFATASPEDLVTAVNRMVATLQVGA